MISGIFAATAVVLLFTTILLGYRFLKQRKELTICRDAISGLVHECGFIIGDEVRPAANARDLVFKSERILGGKNDGYIARYVIAVSRNPENGRALEITITWPRLGEPSIELRKGIPGTERFIPEDAPLAHAAHIIASAKNAIQAYTKMPAKPPESVKFAAINVKPPAEPIVPSVAIVQNGDKQHSEALKPEDTSAVH
jgi:hypothetical protein